MRFQIRSFEIQNRGISCGGEEKKEKKILISLIENRGFCYLCQWTSRGLFLLDRKRIVIVFSYIRSVSIESRYDHVDTAFTVCGGPWIGTRISTEASFDEWRCFACPMARSFIITYSSSFGTTEMEGLEFRFLTENFQDLTVHFRVEYSSVK